MRPGTLHPTIYSRPLAWKTARLPAFEPCGFPIAILRPIDGLLVRARRVRVDRSARNVRSVWLHFPATFLVRQLHVEHEAQFFTKLGGLYGDENLDPVAEIPAHDVCRTDPVLLFSVIEEVIDPAVLEKTADNADHPNVFGQPWNTGPEAT